MLILVLQHFTQIRQAQYFVMSDTSDPTAFASVVNCNALDGKVSVICDDSDNPRGQ